MKILHISNNFTPYTGGVVRSLQTLIPALHSQNVQARLVTLTFEDCSAPDPEWVIRIPCPITFNYKKNPMAVPWRASWHLQELITQFKPDIIHTHHPFLLGSAARVLAHTNNIPIIFTYHTLYEHYAHYLPFAPHVMRPLIGRVVHRFCRSVDGIIAPSAAVQDILKKNNITAAHCIIPSAIAPAFEQLNIPSVSVQNNTLCRLLVVSRFVKEKNLEIILQMIALLPPDYHLTIVGYGAEFERLQSLAFEQLQLGSRVIFVHKPNPPQLIECYQNANLFLFSSQSDTQGIVLAEAMAAGLPIIALDGPGQRDIIKDGYNGYLVHTIQEMALKVQMLWSDRSLLEQLTAHAQITALRFKSDAIARQVIQFYTQILSV